MCCVLPFSNYIKKNSVYPNQSLVSYNFFHTTQQQKSTLLIVGSIQSSFIRNSGCKNGDYTVAEVTFGGENNDKIIFSCFHNITKKYQSIKLLLDTFNVKSYLMLDSMMTIILDRLVDPHELNKTLISYKTEWILFIRNVSQFLMNDDVLHDIALHIIKHSIGGDELDYMKCIIRMNRTFKLNTIYKDDVVCFT
jgi:hypothetical protein